MNASEYQERKSDAILAAIGSAVLHLIIFLLCLWISYLGVQVVQKKTEEQKPEAIVLLRPEHFEREQPKSIAPAPPKEKETKFSVTNPAIAEAEPEEQTKLIGERSTIAASETALNEGDPNIPTQLTREHPREEAPVMYDSRFNEGEAEQIATESSEQEAVAQAGLGEDQISENAKKEVADEIAKKSEIASTTQIPEEIIESQNIVESPKKLVEGNLKKNELAEATTTTEVDGQKEETKSLPKATETAQPSDSGFSSERTKTRIIGSLSRDGKSALNVKSTALGKYYASISKIIEKEWQKNCYKYREHIKPGVISMQFFIDENGKITNPKPHDVVSTSPIQVGFTIKSIRKSTLPKMSTAVKKELEGEKLELIYNFYF